MCKEHDFFPSEHVVYEWRSTYPEFSAMYSLAKLKQADLMAEICIDIADGSTRDTWGVDRLRIDTRKWLASKMLPKTYGDKYILDQKNEENDQLRQEVLELRAKLDAENKKEY